MRSLLSASLSQSTWRKNASAFNCFTEFEKFTGTKNIWPLNDKTVNTFVEWSLLKKGLKHSTVSSYLSSLNFLHKVQGLNGSSCTNFLAKTLIRGAENLDFYKHLTKGSRKVMTLSLLKILGHQLSISGWSKDSIQVIWAVATTAFFGSFRLGEILCSNAQKFTSSEVLTWEDVKFKDDSIVIGIKIPKSRKPKGEFVDLFEVKGYNCCPVAALRKLRMMKGRNTDMKKPVFSFESGICLTPQAMNSVLRSLLTPVMGKSAELFSGHSFRAALPSALANRPDLASDEDIKRWGRWSSPSFEIYTRLKPTQRKIIFYKIVAALKTL